MFSNTVQKRAHRQILALTGPACPQLPSIAPHMACLSSSIITLKRVSPPCGAEPAVCPPCAASKLKLDFASLLGPIFFTWLAQLMLPIMLVSLVYEKQQGCARCIHASAPACETLAETE